MATRLARFGRYQASDSIHYALIRDLQAHRAFARLTLEERALWEARAEARAQAFCDGLAADLALIPAPEDADAD